MRKFILIIILAAFLLTASSTRAATTRVLMPDMSGITLYKEFLDNLQSADITRTDISFDSWYDFVSFTSEQISVVRVSADHKELTYQVRSPLVFWHYPEPNYFDGENYYYKHNNTWFMDGNNRFNNYLQRDFMGIPTHILTDYPVFSDEVYSENNGYLAVICMKSPDDSICYDIEADLDPQKNFKSIDISVVDQSSDGKPAYKHYYHITYDKLNERISVTPPQSFDRSALST